MAEILIIDDERSIRNTLKEIFETENYAADVAENGSLALKMLKNKTYDAIFSDIKMPEMDGIEFLEKAQEAGVEAPIIMISGHGNIETAVESIKKGAYDFIEKPIDLNRLLVVVRNALDKQKSTQKIKTLKREISSRYEMVGQTPQIVRLRQTIATVAQTNARVMICGENGTGKEVVARQIHEQSPRNGAAFIEVNCSAIPSELIESELFGHEKGAFTSAIKQRKGKFEQADGGTLFLDEIGDMSLPAQAKVLRVLQENVVSPVGSDKMIKINVRVIAATNKNLQEEIKKGNFREDLFHRLNVIPIFVPSLDERKADIPLLIDHFNKIICAEQGCAPKTFSVEAISALQERTWRGNIRELRNIVERLIILGDNEISRENVQLLA